jgi:hypothetical protein
MRTLPAFALYDLFFFRGSLLPRRIGVLLVGFLFSFVVFFVFVFRSGLYAESTSRQAETGL